MSVLSAIFYFLSQHYLLSLPLLVLISAGTGVLLARWRGHGGWYSLVGVGFVAGMINIFAGSFFNGLFLAAFGVDGSAVITRAEDTSSQLNNSNIWAYEAVLRTEEGKDVKTGFDTMSASFSPWRNEIIFPPVGERFSVRYIPGFERNLVIMRDQSPFGRRRLLQEAREPVEQARLQLLASPMNADFRREYREALQTFIERYAQEASTEELRRYRDELARVSQEP